VALVVVLVRMAGLVQVVELVPVVQLVVLALRAELPVGLVMPLPLAFSVVRTWGVLVLRLSPRQLLAVWVVVLVQKVGLVRVAELVHLAQMVTA
jgi:hypothetical protein